MYSKKSAFTYHLVNIKPKTKNAFAVIEIQFTYHLVNIKPQNLILLKYWYNFIIDYKYSYINIVFAVNP